jgi:hypothetical protein
MATMVEHGAIPKGGLKGYPSPDNFTHYDTRAAPYWMPAYIKP